MILEKKLRDMQKKLAQIASIPNIIQSTLDTVSKTFEGFLSSNDNEDDDVSTKNTNRMDDDSMANQDTASQLSDVDGSMSYFDDFSNQSDVDLMKEDEQFLEHIQERDSSVEVIVDEEVSEEIYSPEPLEPTEDELMKLEKQNKVNFFCITYNI